MLFFVFAMVAVAAPVSSYSEPDVSWTAEQKLEHLWRQAEETRYSELPKKGPGTLETMKGLWARYLHRTFLHEGEIMPAGRRKVVHPFGVLGRMRFTVTEPNQYTGLFQTGAVGIMRLSLASLDAENFAPGMAAKFLIDGKPSVNMMATYSLDGQGANKDFFANVIGTTLPKPRFDFDRPRNWGRSVAIQVGSIAFRIAGRTMPRGLRSELVLPLDEMAAVDRHGNPVPHFIAPYEVLLVRSSCVQGLIPRDSRAAFQDDLARVPAGEIYEVYARSEPGETPSKLGVITLEGPLEASRFGDEGLFFRHQRPL